MKLSNQRNSSKRVAYLKKKHDSWLTAPHCESLGNTEAQTAFGSQHSRLPKSLNFGQSSKAEVVKKEDGPLKTAAATFKSLRHRCDCIQSMHASDSKLVEANDIVSTFDEEEETLASDFNPQPLFSGCVLSHLLLGMQTP